MKQEADDPYTSQKRWWKRLGWHMRWVRFELFWASALGLLEQDSTLGRYWRRRMRRNVGALKKFVHYLLIIAAKNNATPKSPFLEARSAVRDPSSNAFNPGDMDSGPAPCASRKWDELELVAQLEKQLNSIADIRDNPDAHIQRMARKLVAKGVRLFKRIRRPQTRRSIVREIGSCRSISARIAALDSS